MEDELEVFCKGIADAIRTKKGTTDKINAQKYREEILSIETGLDLNGLIEEYQIIAGETINAGDFVEFIDYRTISMKLNSETDGASKYSSCVLLEPNKVFIAHRYNKYLYGTIVEIDGTTMTATTTHLNSNSNSCMSRLDCTLLEPNKVFIAHSYSNEYFLYGTIVTIDGTTVTATSKNLIYETCSCYTSVCCTKVDTNKVFIGHSYNEKYKYLYGTIVTIDGTNMTPTVKKLTTVSNEKIYNDCDCVLLESNKVFIAHRHGLNAYLYGTIVEIDGTTMNVTSTSLGEGFYYPACILLETNKVFIGNEGLKGTIVEIDGTTMTATTTELTDSYISNSPVCVLLESNKVFMGYNYSNNNETFLYGMIVTINGTTMTATTKKLNYTDKSSGARSCVLLESNKVFIAHDYGSDYYLYGTIYEEDVKSVKGYETKISGVAKQSGTDGETIRVCFPNEE